MHACMLHEWMFHLSLTISYLHLNFHQHCCPQWACHHRRTEVQEVGTCWTNVLMSAAFAFLIGIGWREYRGGGGGVSFDLSFPKIEQTMFWKSRFCLSSSLFRSVYILCKCWRYFWIGGVGMVVKHVSVTWGATLVNGVLSTTCCTTRATQDCN